MLFGFYRLHLLAEAVGLVPVARLNLLAVAAGLYHVHRLHLLAATGVFRWNAA